MAAMHLIRNRLVSADEVQLFADVSRKQTKKKKPKAQQTAIISL